MAREANRYIVRFRTRFEDFVRLHNVVEHRALLDATTPEFGIRNIAQEKQNGLFLSTIEFELEVSKGTFGEMRALILKEVDDGGMAARTLCKCDA